MPPACQDRVRGTRSRPNTLAEGEGWRGGAARESDEAHALHHRYAMAPLPARVLYSCATHHLAKGRTRWATSAQPTQLAALGVPESLWPPNDHSQPPFAS